MTAAFPARFPLAALPTPLEPLPRLSERLGTEIWVKRDDLTGLALGGNKTRKLELLVADARAQGARTLVTVGAAQSNHCRQTAAAAARAGMECILVLAGSSPASVNGNILLDTLLGAELVWSREGDRMAVFEETLARAEHQGRRPYRIPYGGSSPLGAAAYAQALAEFLQHGVAADRLVLASSSGGTQAGLVAGAHLYGYRGRITGISVDQPADALRETVAELASRTAALLGEPVAIHPGEIDVDDGFLGEGYGVLNDLERVAIRTFAAEEGLLLDPVYTGRAAAGMLARIREGRIARDERVVFWHTGGTPALFAYAASLLEQ